MGFFLSKITPKLLFKMQSRSYEKKYKKSLLKKETEKLLLLGLNATRTAISDYLFPRTSLEDYAMVVSGQLRGGSWLVLLLYCFFSFFLRSCSVAPVSLHSSFELLPDVPINIRQETVGK